MAAPTNSSQKTRKILFLCALGLLAVVAVAAALFSGFGSSSGSLDLHLTQTVSANAPLFMEFPVPMNHESVEHELTLPSGVEGEVSWQGSTLVFTPKQTLDAGETYEFVVSGSAKQADETSLGHALVFRFIVTGMPALSAHTPSADARDVMTDAKVTLIFDRPMVALTQVQGDAAGAQMAGWLVTIDPPIKGQWRWLSTYAAQFTPEGGLTPGTLFTVNVPAGIATAAGDKTERDFTWKFETVRPAITVTDPEDGYDLAGPKTQVTLSFNQDMNPDSVRKHLTMFKMSANAAKSPSKVNGYGASSGGPLALPTAAISGSGSIPGGTPVAIKSLRFGKSKADGSEAFVTDKEKIVIETSAPLDLHSQYGVRLTDGVLGATGNLGSSGSYLLHFSTVGPLAVESADFQYGSIVVQFSSPLPDVLEADPAGKNIQFSPKLPKGTDYSYSINTWGDHRALTISPSNLEPSTQYTLTITKGLLDEYDQHLAEPYTFTFKTPPVTPEIALAYSLGEFGIFEKDKPPVYYINDVNVSSVDVEFAKLSLDDFIKIRQQKAGNYNIVPDLTGKELYKTLSIKPKATKDHWESIAFDIQKRLGTTLKPGLYAMLIRAPEFKDYNGTPAVVQQYFALTNTALTLKYSGDKTLVWATDLETGKPVTDATITYRSDIGTTPITGKTDAQGLFESKINMNDFKNLPYDWQPEFWVTAEKAGDFAFVGSNWNSGSNQNNIWMDFHSPMSAPYRLTDQIITDRPVYRPGDTVSFKGIVRLKDWNGLLQLPGSARQMQVAIQDSNGTEVYKKTLAFTEFGGFHDEFKTAENSALGAYTFTLQLLPESDVSNPVYANVFSVLAYRKPEYKIDLTPSADDYLSGQTVDVDLNGAYYFGAPLGNAPVNWRVTLTDYYYNKVTDGWYSFSTEDAWCWWDCQPQSTSFTEGKGTLDAAGHLHIKIPISIDDKKVSQIATIEADVTDPNNQIVSNRVSVPIHKSQVYVGIRNDDYGVAPGESAKLSLITADTKGNPVPNQTVTLTLASRVWNSIRTKGVDGQYTYDNQPTDTVVGTQSVMTGSDGKATASVLLQNGGSYVVTAETTDAKGNVAKAGTSLYAWSSSYVNWPHQNDNSVDVIADKPEYKVGDTAKLLVKSPFQGAGVKALVTVERENVLTKKIIDVPSNALPIEIPITEDLIPNAYVSIVIVKPRVGETFDDQGKDTGVPAFRIGYAQLHIETSKKNLAVTIKTDKKQYLPGEKVTATLSVRNAAGKPVQGEFTMAAVDMSVLALSAFKTPDLVANFYMEHGLGVQTAQMLTYLIERFKPGSKGGGGGDPADRKRGNFLDTAFWNPIVVTNEKGEATVSFTLPDNLTTWQILALGSTKDGLFGGDAHEVLETKNVIIRPVRPRFAVQGDQISLGAIVHNFLPSTKTFAVSLTGSGFTSTGKATQSITLKSGDEQKVLFPVSVRGVKSLTLDMKAVTDSARDEVEEKIPVYIFGTPQSVASTGQTTSLVTEKVLVPSEKDASEGNLSITVSPSLATYLPGGLDYLVEYPYGCAEQTASTFLPQLALKRLQGFDAFKIVPDAALESNIRTALQKLYRFQRADGGFGYWEESIESQPALTAYIVYSLQTAKSTGYSVDENVIKRATDYLNNVLRAGGKFDTSLDLAKRAYILFVLSETGRADGNLLSNLYDKRDHLPVFSQAELAMAMQKSGMTGKAKDLLKHVLDDAKIDPRGAHVEEKHDRAYPEMMQTNTRTTAETLQAMIRLDPGNALIPQFIRFLLAARTDGHWDTTQSTVQTILALVEYLKSTNELDAQYTAGVEVAGKMVLTQKFGKENILTRKDVQLALSELARGKEVEVKIGTDASTTLSTGSKGTLFYDLLLSYFYTGDTIPAADQGMSILRDISTLTPKGPSNVTKVKVGETYRVTLTMTVPEDRRFVAVESPLPAGLEGIDLQLNTSAQGDLPSDVAASQNTSYWWWDDEADSGLWRFIHKEFRDDRVFLFADYLPAGVYKYTYLVRATTPGKFRLRPARMFEMYFPETFGQTEGSWFTVTE